MWLGSALMLFVWIGTALSTFGMEGGNAAPRTPTLRVLTNTVQFRELTIPQAIQGWPIRLAGVVTLVDTNRGMLVLQDTAGALAIDTDLNGTHLRPGCRILLESENAVPVLATFPDFPGNPSGSDWLPLFSAPTNWGNYYLARMRAFLTPPTTGDYTFWIASKGASELWLSTNSDPASIGKIATVATGRATLARQWTKYVTQSSGPIHLQAGQSYLLDAIQENHGGHDDNLSVAWQGPGIPQEIIEGRYLSPYSNPTTNGIIREYWTDYFVAAVSPLISSGVWNSTIALTAPHVTVLGDAEFPEAVPVEAGAPVAPVDNYRWVEAEGVVRFAALDGDVLRMDLVDGDSSTQVRVLDWGTNDVDHLDKVRIEVRGVCESTLDEKGNRVAGVIRVPSRQEVSEIEADAGGFSALKIVPINEINPANPELAWGRQIRVRGTVVRVDTNGLFIQGPGSFTGYISTNGIQWKQVAPSIEIVMTNSSALAGLAVSSFSANSLTTAAFDSVAGLTGVGNSADIFNATPAGEAAIDGSSFTVKGGGVGISSSYDQFHYVYQPLAGNGELIARITSMEAANSRAVAGIMIRDSVDTTASFADLGLSSGGGAVFQFRQKKGERGATINIPDWTAPCWLKIIRRYPGVLARVDKTISVQVGQEVDIGGSLEWVNGQPVLLHIHDLGDAVTKGPQASPQGIIGAASMASEPPTVQIAQLIPEEGEGLKNGSGSVRVRGVVTFDDRVSGDNYLTIQDQSAGVLVRLSPRFTHRSLHMGDLVEFDLRSVNGKWPVPLEPSRINVIGTAQMPEPVAHPAEYSLAGHGTGHWTELEGIVREVKPDGTLKVMCQDGLATAWVGESTAQSLYHFVDARVRIHGVPVPAVDNTRMLLVPSQEFVAVDEPPPQDAFIIPSLSIAELKNFSSPSSAYFHRVKVSGVVIYQKDDLLLVQDESGGLRMRTVDVPKVHVGDVIEAAGFPDVGNGFLSLSETLIRKTEIHGVLKSFQPSPSELQEGGHDAVVVQLTGQLLEQRTLGEDQILELQSGQRIFRATLTKSPVHLEVIPVGSQVEITGVCWMEHVGDPVSSSGLNESLIASFEVLLRSPLDVVVRQHPPWWTWKYTVATISGLLFVLVAALVWIRLLHRQVAQRTRELETAMTKLERETEVSATLAERNRLAGEIHDGLEQGLSAIMMQLDGLESKLGENTGEVGRHLKLARSMIRFSRTEVRHSLWDWKSPALATKDLSAALSEIVGQMSLGNQAQVTVEITGSALPLPSAAEHHLLRTGQEALNNALKYAQAKTIRVNLDYSAQVVRLAVRDDGQGFIPETVLNGTAGHLGLQSLRSRARKMGGSLTVVSAPGQGTTIEVSVPVRKTGPARPPEISASKNEN